MEDTVVDLLRFGGIGKRRVGVLRCAALRTGAEVTFIARQTG